MIKLTASALVFALGLSGCCHSLQCRAVTSDVAACAMGTIPQEVTNLIPAVTSILTGGATNWDSQLKALERLGVGAVVCAVQRVIADLGRMPGAGLKSEPTPEYQRAHFRGESYLKKHGIPVHKSK